jgi:hypothetical protein
MKRCIICRKESVVLHDGMCKKCLGEGGNISLLSAISDKDDKLIKNIEDRVAQGKIVRIM